MRDHKNSNLNLVWKKKASKGRRGVRLRLVGTVISRAAKEGRNQGRKDRRWLGRRVDGWGKEEVELYRKGRVTVRNQTLQELANQELPFQD